MTEPLEPAEGLGVLHLFCAAGPTADAEAVRTAVKGAEEAGLQVVTFAVLGHKADLGFMALGSDLWRLRALQTDLAAAGLEVRDSYVSLTEVSEYAAGVPEKQRRTRLYPELPPAGMSAFCFYGMTKRRDPEQNWYELPYDDRLELMYEHGKSGRTFSGLVVQLVTGSVGLGVHPDDLKACVYTMRYDRASARYAEFGPFTTGLIAPLDEVLQSVGLG